MFINATYHQRTYGFNDLEAAVQFRNAMNGRLEINITLDPDNNEKEFKIHVTF